MGRLWHESVCTTTCEQSSFRIVWEALSSSDDGQGNGNGEVEPEPVGDVTTWSAGTRREAKKRHREYVFSILDLLVRKVILCHFRKCLHLQLSWCWMVSLISH
jgi:hypothetical protein